MRYVLTALILLTLTAGCTKPEDEAGHEPTSTPTPSIPPTETPVTPTASSTPTATATPSPTPTATPSPTPTATPTATAVPMAVGGYPRRAALLTAEDGDGPICGLVDFFDFPLDPPNACGNSRGGSDFGIYRDRFNGHHTGEDWRSAGRGSSLGAPVYSIGRGQVTYAEPLGWGRDKGVVIVRHIFADGRELLSFYGHLDPESLAVRAGDCVARGELLGEIGRPRTPPHLHFEIRTHMPREPGPGYWPEDPEQAGWKPPSATVWDSRMAASPGVIWTRPFATDGVRSVGILDDEVFVALSGGDLIGINTADGRERWRTAVAENVEQAAIDTTVRQIYTANQLGEITAYAVPEDVASAGPQPLWTVDLDVAGLPTLIPLPGAGIVLAAWDRLAAVSAQGAPLWEAQLETRHFDWLVSGGTLIVANIDGERPLWTFDADGFQQWDTTIRGRLAASGEEALLYAGDTVYRLDLAARNAVPVFTLAGVSIQTAYGAPAAGGGVIVAHSDPYDQRLFALDDEGALLWERSIAAAVDRDIDLQAATDQQFLISRSSCASGSEIALFALDVGEPRLTHLFTGGTRTSPRDETRLFGLGDGRVLINIGGRSLVAIDARAAEEIVSPLNGGN